MSGLQVLYQNANGNASLQQQQFNAAISQGAKVKIIATILQGNPNLKPQVTDSFEAGYQYRKQGTILLATGTTKDTTVQLNGDGGRDTVGSAQTIVDDYVPVGAISFSVASSATCRRSFV